MIIQKIKQQIHPGMIIPKPEATANFKVKGWGMRRGEPALAYLIPNHGQPEYPYQKGITTSEFESAYNELKRAGELTRTWFDANLRECAREGGCNYTTIGGIFELIGIAKYADRGVYRIYHQNEL